MPDYLRGNFIMSKASNIFINLELNILSGQHICNMFQGGWHKFFFDRAFGVSRVHEMLLTHWGQVICVSNSIIGSDNGLLPGRRQDITWTNAIILIGPLETNFSEFLIESHTFSFMKMPENVVWKMGAILSLPQCVKPWIFHTLS